jgi:hypothetical protein
MVAINMSPELESQGHRDDSLFGDPDALEAPSDGNTSVAGVKWRMSEEDPKVQVIGPTTDTEEEQQPIREQPPKRRGRPPKQTLTQANATSTPEASARTTRLLSLKEKLASKGKVFKIVRETPQESTESPAVTPAAPTSRRTPSIVIARSVAKSTPLLNPGGPANLSSLVVVEIIRKDSADNIAEACQVVRLLDSDPSILARPAEQPVKKVPTVVRLESPSDSYSSESSRPRDSLLSSDDDDDESIPAVRPAPLKAVRGGQSLSGSVRGTSNGLG